MTSTTAAPTADQPVPETSEPELPAELQAPGYEIFIGLLAVISLINLAIWVLPFDADTKAVANIMDGPITAIFLLDFTNRLLRSHPRRVYFIEQRGWLDLLGSLPAFFKLFRLFRLTRVYKLLSEYGIKNIVRAFIKDRANNALLVVVFVVLLILEFGSMIVLYFEADAPGANITTGGDAIWWAFVSITTVGYGDKFPITQGGRVTATLILAAGVGMFGVLSGFLANFFLSPSGSDAEPATEPESAVSTGPAATATVTAAASAGDDQDLLRMIDELEAGVVALRARLAERPEPSNPA